MPKSNIFINCFNTGEVSPLINATRSDLSKYQSACRKLENAFPLVEGGARKMPGTQYAGLTKYSSTNQSRLVPFSFSTGQGCILEVGQEYIRIWENGGLLEGALSPIEIQALIASGVTDYNPATAYGQSGLCFVGSVATVKLVPGNLYIASPYSQGSPTSQTTWPMINISLNSTDALAVTTLGQGATQTISIALSNTTQSNNSAANIQAAIRALGSIYLEAGCSNTPVMLSLSAWTVTADVGYASYSGSPAALFSVAPTDFSVNIYAVLQAFRCLSSNQTNYFPTGATSIWQPYTTPGYAVQVTTPYMEADIFDLDFLQSADVVYICHPLYPPAILSSLTPTYCTYAPFICRGTQDVAKTGYSALAVFITGASNDSNKMLIEVYSTSQPFSNGDRIYINQVAGAVQLNGSEYIVSDFHNVATDLWQFHVVDPNTGAYVNPTNWGGYDGGGFAVKVVPLFAAPGDYPACATFYEQRLCFGGSLNNPLQINGSTQGDYPEFICDPNEADHAIIFTLVSEKVDPIRRMTVAPTALLLGTAGGVWSMAGSGGQSLSQNSVDAEKQTSTGVAVLDPQRANDVGIWISRSNRIVYFIIYNFVTNQWENIDITRLNRQITIGTSMATSGIVQTAFQAEPYPIFWAVRADGQLLGLIFNKQDNVFAWFRIITAGTIESVACIPQDEAEDQVWLIVNRTINGVTQRFVEYFMPQELFGQLSNAFFVHAGLQWNGGAAASITNITQANPCVVTAPSHGFQTGYQIQITGVQGMTQINQDPSSAYAITVIDANNFSLNTINSTIWSPYTSGGTVAQVTNQVSGLTYLQGQTVVAVGDGSLISGDNGIVVPASGIVVFPFYCNLITVGLPYTTIIEPVNPIIGAQAQGSSEGDIQKVSQIDVSVYQSIGGKYGSSSNDTLYPLSYGPGSIGQAPQMVTMDDISVDFPGDWGYKANLSIVHDQPLPFTLRSISAKISVNPS